MSEWNLGNVYKDKKEEENYDYEDNEEADDDLYDDDEDYDDYNDGEWDEEDE